MERTALIQAILAHLETELNLQTEAAHMARAEATDEESRAEDKYDMRSQSAAYLAAGQARLATEINAAISAYRSLPAGRFDAQTAIAVGAIITLEARGQRTIYFLGPLHGGIEVRLDGVEVTVITSASPLGRQLAGRKVGDTVMLPGRAGPVPHKIVTVE